MKYVATSALLDPGNARPAALSALSICFRFKLAENTAAALIW
jgi:hypothetical protein